MEGGFLFAELRLCFVFLSVLQVWKEEIGTDIFLSKAQ